MARTQYTFTFTNAQQGAQVHLSTPGFGQVDVYATADEGLPNDDDLILDANNSVSVWANVGELIARTIDGRGKVLELTATKATPTQTSSEGFSSTFASGASAPVTERYLATHQPTGTTFVYADWSEGSVGDPPLLDTSTANAPVVSADGLYLIQMYAQATGGDITSGNSVFVDIEVDVDGADYNAACTLYPSDWNPADSTSIIAQLTAGMKLGVGVRSSMALANAVAARIWVTKLA